MSSGSTFKPFSSAAALQEFLLKEAGPGSLVLVPHQRLARQVWRRQRQRAREQGRAAWEPLPLTTLGNWWGDLSRSLWLDQAVASPLPRLACWRTALETGPPLDGITADLAWAQALDAAYSLLARHRLPLTTADPQDSPLVSWRRRLTAFFEEICREEGYLPPVELPGYLLKALEAGHIALPPKLLVAGLETPAPVEEAWLQAVSRRIPVLHLDRKSVV